MSGLSAFLIILAILFVLCSFAYITHRCRKERANLRYCDENNSIPILSPSAPPLDTSAERPLQSNNGHSLNTERQAPVSYTHNSGSQELPAHGDCLTSETRMDDNRVIGFRTEQTSIADDESSRTLQSGYNTSDQPPTYEEAMSDPSLQAEK